MDAGDDDSFPETDTSFSRLVALPCLKGGRMPVVVRVEMFYSHLSHASYLTDANQKPCSANLLAQWIQRSVIRQRGIGKSVGLTKERVNMPTAEEDLLCCPSLGDMIDSYWSRDFFHVPSWIESGSGDIYSTIVDREA